VLKVIYPITSDVGRRASAWARLHQVCKKYDFATSRPKLREETFDANIVFHHLGGEPMTEKRRVYTFTFYVERTAADKLIAQLCNREQKLARLLTCNTMLLCLDDDLGVRSS
jgi:hypothetical protein